jgi:hypothetical protein
MAKKSEPVQLTAADLRRAADLQDKITAMHADLARLLGGVGSAPVKAAKTPKAVKAPKPARRKPNISDAGRRRIAAAQKARWAKVKAEKAATAEKPKAEAKAAKKAK